ncbi:MAG TPA: HEAT repeat domain-containing protein [Gemmatimonadota bacterium]|nr:HEAT repeat domain-containing protein [Gemmatimonadota bacterium]
MSFWLDALVKGTALLIVIFGLAAVSGRWSAATRHLLWCFGLVGLLILPALSSVTPWHLPVLPPVEGAAIGEILPTTAPEAARDRTATGAEGSVLEAGDPVFPPASALRAPIATPEAGEGGDLPLGFGDVLLAIWVAGAILILARLVAGLVTLRRYTVRACPASGERWEEACEWARSRLLLDAPVRLLVTGEVAMPLAAGVLRPTVLMPEEAEGWPEARRRAVLLHELAHVKRRDIVPHLMAWVVCAVWWFHPLAWSAARRMRSESEKACDDLVLKVGTRASRYADDLLDIVTRAGAVRAPAAVVPLAQRSEFEGRILAILEPDRRRQAASVTHAALVALAVALFAVPLAAVAPGVVDSKPASIEPGDRAEEKSLGEKIAATFRGEPDLDKDKDADKDKDIDYEIEESSASGPSSVPEIVISGLESWGDLGGQTEQRFGGDSRAVVALITALSDDDPNVRLSAAETLGKFGDPRAVQALIQALRQDPDPKVRAMAAWALGEIEDPAAVSALSTALREDDDPVVRVHAAEALGNIEDALAIGVLGDAVKDTEVQVRRAAVEALGNMDDARVVPLIVPSLRDDDVQVRRSAADALGNNESAAAVEPLIAATRDPDIEVRISAIQALGNQGDARAEAVLLDALADERADVRREAIDAIGNLDLGRAPRQVIDAVRDPDREVRYEAVDALGNFEDPAAVPVLLEIVRGSTDRELQYEALDALSNISSPAAYDALIPLLQHEDPKVRQLAAEAIGNMQ